MKSRNIDEVNFRITRAIANQEVVDNGGLDAASGRPAYQTLLDRGVKPTAIICSNDLIAVGVTWSVKPKVCECLKLSQ